MCLPLECVDNDVKMIFMHAVTILPSNDLVPFNTSVLLAGSYQVRCQEEKHFDIFSTCAMYNKVCFIILKSEL